MKQGIRPLPAALGAGVLAGIIAIIVSLGGAGAAVNAAALAAQVGQGTCTFVDYSDGSRDTHCGPPTPIATPTPTPTVQPTTTAPPTTTIPPTTTVAPTTTPPATTVPPTSPPPGAVTHGSQISPANTGWAAWVGPAGQRCTQATMTVYTTKISATSLPAGISGRTATCVWLQQGINVNTNVTLTAARIDAQIDAPSSRLMLNWSTVDATGDEWAVGYHVDALRSQLINGSDGVRFEGTNIVECWVRVKQINSQDHNDGVQAYLADSGGSILRSNIDSRPGVAGVYGTAAIFIADKSQGEYVIRDNLLAGGNGTLRLHESGFYRVTGNRVVAGSWNGNTGPYSNAAQVPNAIREWLDNATTAGVPFGP